MPGTAPILAAVLLLGLAGCGGAPEPGSSGTASGTASSGSPSATSAAGPDSPREGPTGVLPATDGSASVVGPKVEVGGAPCGVAVAFGAVWVSVNDTAELVRIDPASGAVTHRSPLSDKPCEITATKDALWVVTQSGVVDRVDPTTRRVLASVPTGFASYEAVEAFGSIWVSNRNGQSLTRVDPATNATTTVELPGVNAGGIAASADALWVGDDTTGSSTMARVDPETLAVTSVEVGGSRPAYVAATADRVWVSRVKSGSVSMVDAATGEVRRATDLRGVLTRQPRRQPRRPLGLGPRRRDEPPHPDRRGDGGRGRAARGREGARRRRAHRRGHLGHELRRRQRLVRRPRLKAGAEVARGQSSRSSPARARAASRSSPASRHTSSAAAPLTRTMTAPRTRSGHPEAVTAVTPAIAMIARLTATSDRAERKAAAERDPPWCRTRVRRRAHAPLTSAAPPAVSTSGHTAGATGSDTFATACHAAASAGTRMTPAITRPATARRASVHPRASATRRLIAVSSRKSTESARRDTDPMESATDASTPKYARLSPATTRTTRRRAVASTTGGGATRP